MIGAEEKSVIVAEEGLGFSEVNVTRVYSIIKKYSSNGTSNHKHLQRIGEVLGLQITNEAPHSKIETFYRKLSNKEGFYPLKDLLVVGILLAQGTVEEKARLIYQVYDETLTNSLPVSVLNTTMLKDLAYMSAQVFPLLVTNDQTPFSNVLKNEKYMQDLAKISEAAVLKVFSNFSRFNTIDEDSFVYVFKRIADGTLMTSTGWRMFMMETLIIDPPKRNFNNPFSSNQGK